MDIALDDVPVVVDAICTVAERAAHEDPFDHTPDDWGFVRWEEPWVHHAFHFIARQLAATTVFECVDRSEHGEIPRGISPRAWLRWFGPQRLAEHAQETITHRLDMRAWLPWTRTGDAQALERCLADAAAHGCARSGELLTGLREAMSALVVTAPEEIEYALARATCDVVHVGDYGQLWWNDEAAHAWWVAADADGDVDGTTDPERIRALLAAVPGVREVTVADEHGPTDRADEHRDGWLLVDVDALTGRTTVLDALAEAAKAIGLRTLIVLGRVPAPAADDTPAASAFVGAVDGQTAAGISLHLSEVTGCRIGALSLDALGEDTSVLGPATIVVDDDNEWGTLRHAMRVAAGDA